MTAKDLRVLVVDDDHDVLASIADALAEKFTVLTASSGAEALTIIAAEQPEIVLTDQRLAPMTGLELLEQGYTQFSCRFYTYCMSRHNFFGGKQLWVK